MKTAICALTNTGCDLAVSLGKILGFEVYIKEDRGRGKTGEHIHYFSCSLKDLISSVYREYDSFLMIMAAGIVFRSFAPLLVHKTVDPAIVVMDEKGQFAISLLSGHLGGGNALTRHIADVSGATPVITTATDVNGVLAFDLFAKANDCFIENIEALKYFNGAMVNGEAVEVFTDREIEGIMPLGVFPYQGGRPKYLVVISHHRQTPQGEHTLYLRPKDLVLGCGCKKNTSEEDFYSSVEKLFTANNFCLTSVKSIASIDLKKNEPCLISFAKNERLEFLTFSTDALGSLDDIQGSDFVAKVTGTKSVAEAAARLGAMGTTLVKKTIFPGITLSLAQCGFGLTWNI